MELWHGNLGSFVGDAVSGSMGLRLWEAFQRYNGHPPSQSEASSWQHSLSAVANAASALKEKDIGVVCEYHLQFSKRRIDVVFLGRGEGSHDRAAIVELKQWAKAELIDSESNNLRVADTEVLHPSEQALNYRHTLEDTHSAFVELGMLGASSAYCHDMSPKHAAPLRDQRFSQLLYRSPLFDKSDAPKLCEYLDVNIGQGGGAKCLEAFRGGRFRPSPRLLDVLEETIKSDRRWTLIDTQQVAYNAIWAEVCAALKHGVRDSQVTTKAPIIIVRGAPGTGKTVIAVRLLRDAIKHGLSAVHSTGGKAFTIAMRSAFDEAKELFIWNMSLRRATYKGIDLLLVDEAHRLRKTSDTRFTPAAERGRKSQFEELIDAARLTVFFVDDNQYIRPDEIGSSTMLRSEATRLQIPTKDYRLEEQFRCGGCVEYVNWVESTLGFEESPRQSWGDSYKVAIVNTAEGLEARVRDAAASGMNARMVAGFCWRWSKPNSDGSLVSDVEIGSWSRPWNRKALDSKQYPPAEHPYTLWARTEAGLGQVGSIYSAQGFEFDVVGVIWGEDLVWRNGQWVAQRSKSYDRPVIGGNADSLRLFRNAYRVLLTRGIRETVILCLDPETKEYLAEAINSTNA